MRDVRILGVHRFVLRLALAAGTIFAWLIVFKTFEALGADEAASLAGTATLYALSYGITLILTPLAAHSLRHGIRRSLIFATLAAAIAFFFIAELLQAPLLTPQSALSFMAGFVVFFALYRALYFLPYRESEARFLETPSLVSEMAVACMPFVAGMVLAHFFFGEELLFALASFVIVASAIVLFFIHESYEPFQWRYGEVVRELLAKQNRRAVLLFILDGIQGAALLFIWPLAVFLIVGKADLFGAILTLSLLAALCGRYLMRLVLRTLRLSRSPHVLAALAFSGWLLKIGAATPIEIIAVNTYYLAGSPPGRIGVDPRAFEQAADGGRYIDEYTAVKEMGHAFGRLFVVGLFAYLAYTVAPAAAFALALLLAAVSAAASIFISHRLQKAAF